MISKRQIIKRAHSIIRLLNSSNQTNECIDEMENKLFENIEKLRKRTLSYDEEQQLLKMNSNERIEFAIQITKLHKP